MVKRSAYTPDRGDIVWISLDPQKGREQSGRRPALVISPKEYNKKSGLALMCPVTSKTKGYPFEMPLSDGSAVLADHVKSLDWQARGAEKKGVVNTRVTQTVQQLLTILITE